MEIKRVVMAPVPRRKPWKRLFIKLNTTNGIKARQKKIASSKDSPAKFFGKNIRQSSFGKNTVKLKGNSRNRKL